MLCKHGYNNCCKKDINMINCKWFVWAVGGSTPVYQHTNEESAITEAKRLSANFPGKLFYICKSIGEFFTVIPPMPTPVYAAHRDYDDKIPF